MKNYEIGSDFYFTPEKLNKINLIKLKLNSNEYKLENDEISKNILKRDKSTKQVLLGRNAINLVLLDLLENLENKKALIPAYTCETVIQPFLDNGFEIFYYEVDKSLNIKISEINKLIKKNEIKIVFLQPMFGFNTIDFDEKILETKVVLDNTHGYFSNLQINFQDYTIVSLRKWFGIPDGALIIKSDGELTISLKEVEKDFINLAKKAFNKKYNYLFLNNGIKDNFRELYKKIKDSLEFMNIDYSMSSLTKDLIFVEDFSFLKNQRRKNFSLLLKYFNNRHKYYEDLVVKPIFNYLNEGIVPLYFPVYVYNGKRDEFQKYMAENNVFCPIIWPIPSNLHLSKISPDLKWIYDHISVIPIDQRYSEKDMEYILIKIEKFEKKIKESLLD